MTGKPILVSGMPRSGNTWLARLLATASGTALTGREPMNPRGRQYALAKTLPGWASVQTLTPRQARALRSCYRGLNPMVYSRYGRRQWAAALPGTRTIIKDPFAMLSLPAVVGATGAKAVLVYRHPGAALTSYRRMGWAPDLVELQVVIDQRREAGLDPVPVVDLPRPDDASEPVAMGLFWAALYRMTLNDAARTPGLVVLSHPEIAGGGVRAGQSLFSELGLSWTDESAAELTQGASGSKATADADAGGGGNDTGRDHGAVDPKTLHNFDRNPGEVASSWRGRLGQTEIDAIESVTEQVRADLYAARFTLLGS